MAVTKRSNAQKPVQHATIESKSGQTVHEFQVPQYTVKELLGAIPAECYERSALHSSLYIVQDVVLIGLAVWGSLYIPTLIEKADLNKLGSKVLLVLLWNVFWFWTGVFGTGLWVIAHECGHQGFSDSKTINNAVGWVLHSALGVPYHSWRISHARHHAATGHMTRDEVFVPRTREQHKYPAFDATREDLQGHNVTPERQSELAEAIGDAPFIVMLNLIAQQLVGWPAYLIRNASGQKHYPKWTNHFQPSSIIFEKRHRMQVIMSDVGIALLFAVLGTWTYYRGFSEVVTYYLIPYLYVNHWLVAIVYIQHTDPLVPHYSNSVWTFPRGALTTIDRNLLWFIGPYLMHGIAETHVSHHVSSKIPHYNAWKATEHLKAFLGKDYQYREGNFLVALYTAFRSCRYVDTAPDQHVIFYKDARGVGHAKADFGGGGNVSDSGVDVDDDEKFRIE